LADVGGHGPAVLVAAPDSVIVPHEPRGIVRQRAK